VPTVGARGRGRADRQRLALQHLLLAAPDRCSRRCRRASRSDQHSGDGAARTQRDDVCMARRRREHHLRDLARERRILRSSRGACVLGRARRNRCCWLRAGRMAKSSQGGGGHVSSRGRASAVLIARVNASAVRATTRRPGLRAQPTARRRRRNTNANVNANSGSPPVSPDDAQPAQPPPIEMSNVQLVMSQRVPDSHSSLAATLR
jgi:hypothetical protein